MHGDRQVEAGSVTIRLAGALVVSSALVVLVAWGGRAAGEQAVAGRIIDQSALARHGCPGCRVLTQGNRSLSEVGRTIHRSKVVDPAFGVKVLSFDERLLPLSEQQFAALEAQDRSARLARLGNLSEAAWAAMKTMPSGSSVRIRAFAPPVIELGDKSELLADPAKMNARKAEIAAADAHVSREVRAALERAGASDVQSEGRIISARATPAALARIKDVPGIVMTAIDMNEPIRPADDHLNVIRNRNLSGITGSGQKVGFIEVLPPAVNFLSHLTGLPAGGRRCEPNCPPGGTHSVNMMGIVRRADAFWSITTAAQTVVSNAGEFGALSDDAAWLIDTWGTRVINGSIVRGFACPIDVNSSAFIDGMDFDLRAKSAPFPLFILAAGNDGSCVRNVTFNGLVVGGTTHSTSERVPSVMWPSSNWQNPTVASPHADRELPHLVAPACPTDITSDGCGTSDATAQVSGVVARLRSTPEAAGFDGWPEVFRAVTMATADLNVEGQEYFSRSFETEPDIKDGVGLLHAKRALDVMLASDVDPVQNPNLIGGVKNLTFFASNPAFQDFAVKATGAVKFRIALAFNAAPNVAQKTYVLDSDIDLFLMAGGLSVTCAHPGSGERPSSTSFDNTHEFLACTVQNPPADGLYTIRVQRGTMATSVAWAGLAWTISAVGSPP